MQDMLEALGLTQYESRALDILLRHGPRTAPDLAREADIPTGRIYDTLNALIERSLCTVRAGRPKTYNAAPAAVLPTRLLATNKRRLQEEERVLGQHAAALENTLARLSPRSAPGGTLYGVRIGEDPAREFLVEATHAAQRSVDAFLVFEHIRDDDLALFEAFRNAVVRGVRTRILLREQDIDFLLNTPYVEPVMEALLPHLGDNLQVRLCQYDSVPFSVLDEERVVLGIKNPLDPRYYFAVVHMDDRAFADDLIDKYDTLWNDASFDAERLQGLLGRRSGRSLLRLGNKLRPGRTSKARNGE